MLPGFEILAEPRSTIGIARWQIQDRGEAEAQDRFRGLGRSNWVYFIGGGRGGMFAYCAHM